MTPEKRIFDIGLALCASVLLLLPAMLIAAALLISQGRPIFFVSERMKTPTEAFLLWKFRTMQVATADSGVSGGNKAGRITRFGGTLRRARLDELPQLWNVLRGDISFVGPRPPLRIYVERFPQLYGAVLQSRPGLTGLATLVFHTREEQLLSACKTTAETDEIYVKKCIPRKAVLDLIYQKNQSVPLDAFVISQTMRKLYSKIRSA